MKALLLALPLLIFSGAVLASPETDAAIHEIDSFAAMQAKTDPLYKNIEKELLPRMTAIVKDSPPDGWMPQIKRMYFAISERLHREEGDAIWADEQNRIGPTRFNQDAGIRSQALQERFDEMTRGLEEGRYSPREQAIHAFAAASILFPNDPGLIAWRRAKVPISTAYEMGNIDRQEFDARWAVATSAYERSRADNARDIDALRAQIISEAMAAQRARAPIHCTAVPGLAGRVMTSCQ